MANDQEQQAPAATLSVDTSRAPRGELAARALVEAVAAGDDRVERHFLEVKGPLDLTTKKDQAKLAKFILGAANRMPELSATAFEGYAVMVIGVTDGEAVGIPPIEVLEIQKAVRPFLGASGPQWDVIRVPADIEGSEVLLLVVAPPTYGQGPFVCLRDGEEKLRDGAVFVRADGETREAKGDELNVLIARGQARTPAANFTVTVAGRATPTDLTDDAACNQFIEAQRRRLLDALPKPKPATEGTTTPRHRTFDLTSILDEAGRDPLATATGSLLDALSAPSRISFGNVMTEPEKRTEAEYRQQIEDWAQRFREAWPAAAKRLAGYSLSPIEVQVQNLETTFFYDVALKIHLEGDVEAVELRETYNDRPPSVRDLKLPNPPRKWGPRNVDPLAGMHSQYAVQSASSYLPSTHSPMTWRNTGSVTIELAVGDLRPRGMYSFDEGDAVLIVPRKFDGPVRGTWEITARDHHAIYRGDLTVQVGEPLDITSEMREILDSM